MTTTYVPCPVCKSGKCDLFVSAKPHDSNLPGEYKIVKCSSCECLYLNPALDGESLRDAYSVLHRKSAITSRPLSNTAPKTILPVKWWRNYCSYQISGHVLHGPVLDLGCNDGELMEELKAKGFETFGVEFSSAAVATCRRKQLQVEEANLETLELPAGKFKTIVLSHVLEHLGNPVEILSRVKHGLADGGSIVICVPNVNSPMRTLFGSNWHGWDPPFHLVHYSPSSLKRVCENAGLRVTRIARRMIPDDLRRSLVLLEKRPKRHILVRIVAIPVLMGLSLLGFGSYLLLIAERPSETSGSGRTKF